MGIFNNPKLIAPLQIPLAIIPPLHDFNIKHAFLIPSFESENGVFFLEERKGEAVVCILLSLRCKLFNEELFLTNNGALMKIKFSLIALALSSLFALTAHAQALNDKQIAEIMETANDAEIDAGKLAEDDAKSAEVKEFAKHMVEQHKMNLKEVKKVAKKNDIDTEKTEMSKALKEDAKNKKSLLKKQKDMAFDKMYIDQQISMHSQLLNDLDQKFIPAAVKPEFKAYLQATREHVSQHLEKAKAIQIKL